MNMVIFSFWLTIQGHFSYKLIVQNLICQISDGTLNIKSQELQSI